MSDAASHPRLLDLPRDVTGLATSRTAVRRLQELLPVFINEHMARADADGVVLELDGEVESSVAAAMAVDGLTPEKVTGLVMPAQLTEEATARDAETVASLLGIECRRFPMRPLMTAFQRVVETAGEPADDLVATRNVSERLRMACTYYVANTTNRLVVGSVNRTERLLGSVAKYGENGVDISLLGDLYRTEVEALARDLDIPEEILKKSPNHSSQISPGDAETLGIEPERLDRLLRLHIDKGRPASTVAERLDVETEMVRRAMKWCANTRHKRHQPSKPSMNI